MEETYLMRLARLEMEERVVQIRYELASGEACADGGGFPGGRDLEEQLLVELAELELALLTRRYGPHASRRSLSATVEWEGG
jgi:hypothetical protein